MCRLLVWSLFVGICLQGTTEGRVLQLDGLTKPMEAVAKRDAQIRSAAQSEAAPIAEWLYFDAPKNWQQKLRRREFEKGGWCIGIVEAAEQARMRKRESEGWTQTENGGWVYVAAVSAAGVQALRVQLCGVAMPDEAVIYVCSSSQPQDVAGPLRLKNAGEAVWAGTVFSELVFVECRVPAGHEKPDGIPFDIVAVAQIMELPGPMEKALRSAAWCTRDVSCYSSDWQQSGNGVALYEFVEDGYAYSCSGCLLNNCGNGFHGLFSYGESLYF